MVMGMFVMEMRMFVVVSFRMKKFVIVCSFLLCIMMKQIDIFLMSVIRVIMIRIVFLMYSLVMEVVLWFVSVKWLYEVEFLDVILLIVFRILKCF